MQRNQFLRSDFDANEALASQAQSLKVGKHFAAPAPKRTPVVKQTSNTLRVLGALIDIRAAARFVGL